MSIIHPRFESFYVFFKFHSYVFLSVSASESRHIKMKSSRHIDDSISEPSSEIEKTRFILI